MSFLGIDLGTGSLKLAIIDEEGREQCATSVAYAIDTPQPGWAEIDPQIWWRALCEAAARLPDWGKPWASPRIDTYSPGANE